jgi:hypothetical protein
MRSRFPREGFGNWVQNLCKHLTARFKKDVVGAKKVLPPEALRALAEAEERCKQADKASKASQPPKETGGTGGPEPTRYGDWENKGIASDF